MTRPCPKCNQMNPPDAAFCLNCSSPLSPSGGGQPYQTPNAPYVGGQAPYVGTPQPYMGGQAPAVSGGASSRAIISLVLAIAALVLCCGPLTGIPSAILGWMELDAINKGQSSAAGKWMAQVGLWGGIALTVIGGIGLVIWILLVLMAGANQY